MKFYCIAGEDSGDLHGSNLLKALKGQHADVQVSGLGGDLMKAQGMKLSAHVRDINFMGFWEVLRHLGTIRRLFRKVENEIRDWRPDAIILIDYPGFNLRIAKFAHALGIPVYYYISPQVWAWKKGRVRKIKAYVRRMMVILPFEKDFFRKEGLEVDFVGHPLLDAIGTVENEQTEKPLVALLPGSRQQEIKRMLPVMLDMVNRFPQFRFVIAGAPSQKESFYQELIGKKDVSLRMGETYAVLREADYALVTSGTATLETALHGVPEVVCYTGNPLSYAIGKRLVKVKYISLVNLILDRPAVKELIQHDFTVKKLAEALTDLTRAETQKRLAADYDELRMKLGDKGASHRAAAVIWEDLQAKMKVST